jgi:hypothetical protein
MVGSRWDRSSGLASVSDLLTANGLPRARGEYRMKFSPRRCIVCNWR